MSMSRWQKSLEDAFSNGRLVAASVLPVIEAEQAFEQATVSTFHGFSVLSDCFHSFYKDTLEKADQERALCQPNLKSYALLLLTHSGAFRRFRAAEIAMRHGYPLAGFALLRDLKDQAICLCGVARGETNLDRLNGIWEEEGKGIAEVAFPELRKRRKSEEGRVFKQIVGARSGLPNNVQHDLRHWSEMFDREVHGSRLTLAAETSKWRSGQCRLSLQPEFEKLSPSLHMFFNRFEEAAWLIHRLLPCLQLANGGFGSSWAKKWAVLNSAFEQVLVGNAKSQKRKLSISIINLAHAKFAFTPEQSFHTETSSPPLP